MTNYLAPQRCGFFNRNAGFSPAKLRFTTMIPAAVVVITLGVSYYANDIDLLWVHWRIPSMTAESWMLSGCDSLHQVPQEGLRF